MPYQQEFDAIRPYYDKEVPQVVERLVRERGFLQFMKTFFPEYSTKAIIQELLKTKTISHFQRHWVYPLVQRIIHGTVNRLTVSGLSDLDNSYSYLFISNHRDIVLDSALLQFLLVTNGFRTTEIAIGSNLLILDWIIDLVKLNRTFIVKRDVPQRELYSYSVNLSKYIRYVIEEQGESIWLAQREGRTKNGDDKTQIGVLKMLNMSGGRDILENFEKLNIVPVAISYEIEPMAVAKVQELYNRKINPVYKKTKLEDLNSMDGGIEQKKGHVHYGFGRPLNELLYELKGIRNRKELFNRLAELIDSEIYANYKLTFYNFAAADKFFRTHRYSKYYDNNQRKIFEEYFEQSMSQLDGEREVLEQMFLSIYAMPVKNYEKVKKLD